MNVALSNLRNISHVALLIIGVKGHNKFHTHTCTYMYQSRCRVRRSHEIGVNTCGDFFLNKTKTSTWSEKPGESYGITIWEKSSWPIQLKLGRDVKSCKIVNRPASQILVI